MAKRDLEQTQILEAISFYKDIKKQSAKTNPKIVEYLNRAENGLHEELYMLLNSKTTKTRKINVPILNSNVPK